MNNFERTIVTRPFISLEDEQLRHMLLLVLDSIERIGDLADNQEDLKWFQFIKSADYRSGIQERAQSSRDMLRTVLNLPGEGMAQD